MSEHDEATRIADAVQKRLFIDGKWVDAAEDPRSTSSTPPPARRCARSPTPAGGRQGRLDAAVAAQPEFAATSPRERADILTRAFDLLHERIDDLALLMTLEMGKPWPRPRRNRLRRDFLRHFAGEAVRIGGGYQTAPAGERASWSPGSRWAPACSSRRGTSRWRWAPASSVRPSRPAAPVSSSRRTRPRCRCWRWWTSSPRRACPPAPSTASPRPTRAG